jgi:Putative zinc-finger
MTDQGDLMAHDRMRAALPELAADVLDGRARAELLAHVDRCPSCAPELEELTAAVDSLAHLVGEADPPVGFETRVFEEMRRRPSRARRHRRAWRRPLVAVTVAAAVAALAFGLGWAAHPLGGSPAHTAVTVPPSVGDRPVEASLVSAGRTVGVVSVYAGRPAWLSMRVEGSSWAGPVLCRVTSADGTSHSVGWFSLTSGFGMWTARLPAGAHSIRSASLVDPGGRILATARFTPAVIDA